MSLMGGKGADAMQQKDEEFAMDYGTSAIDEITTNNSPRRRARNLPVITGAACGMLLGAAGWGLLGQATTTALAVQDPSTQQNQAAQPAGRPAPDAANPAGMGQMLLQAMRSVEGCLGVDAGQFSSGKNVIVGWFEDVEAARRWYYHPMHQGLMRRVGERAEDDKPLAHVQAGVSLMIVASITFSDRPQIEAIPMPISQIGIEIYQAAPGGAYINGKLAPDTFRVEHMRNLAAPAAPNSTP